MELNTDQLIDRGRQAFERRDYAAALADFREVLDRHGHFADVRHLAGLCLSFLGQPEAALEEFDRALELNGEYIEAHLNRAITLNELGRYEEAQQAFEDAWRCESQAEGPFPAAISARLANAHASLGDLYLEAGAPTEAADQYRVALRMRPRFLDIRNKLAQALLQLGELEEAEKELRFALEGNPRFLAARLNLGLVNFRRERFDNAARQWEQCSEQQPGNPQVRAYLAMLQRRAAVAPGGEAS